MVLVFIFIGILLLIATVIILNTFSTIRITIKNFYASNYNKPKNNVNKNIEKEETKFSVTVSLYLFDKIKWLSFNLNSKRANKMYSKMQLEKMDIKKLQDSFKVSNLKELKRLKPEISLLDLDLKLGTEDAIITSFLIFLISTAIGMLLPYVIKKYKQENYRYIVTPLYYQKNLYEIKLNCIIQVKMVHIINIVYVLLKKRRSDKNERTSNRRSYDYSYE